MTRGQRSTFEETDEGLLIHLAEGARLVRLGSSVVVLAEPFDDDTEGVSARLAMDGGTTFSCVCRGTGNCELVIKPRGDSLVHLVCVAKNCGGCSRWIIDRNLWNNVSFAEILSLAMQASDS